MKNRINLTFYPFICLIMATGCMADDETSTGSPLPNWEGVWVAERQFGPLLQGPLTVQQSGEHWVARLQGETVAVERNRLDNGLINWPFSFFGQGHFVGQQPKEGATIDGHWFQPPGIMENFPVATPV